MSESDANEDKGWFSGISSFFVKDSQPAVSSTSQSTPLSTYPPCAAPSSLRYVNVYGEPELDVLTHSKRSRRLYRIISSDTLDFDELVKNTWHGIPSHLRALIWAHLLGYLPAQQSISSTRRGQSLLRKRVEYAKSVHNHYYLVGHHTTHPYVFPIMEYVAAEQQRCLRDEEDRQQLSSACNIPTGGGGNTNPLIASLDSPTSTAMATATQMHPTTHPHSQQQGAGDGAGSTHHQHMAFHQPMAILSAPAMGGGFPHVGFESTLDFQDSVSLPSQPKLAPVGQSTASATPPSSSPLSSHYHTMPPAPHLASSTAIANSTASPTVSTAFTNRGMAQSRGVGSSVGVNTGGGMSGHNQLFLPSAPKPLPGSPAERALLHQIRIDIPRTLPEEPLFQLPMIKGMFERILFVWSIRHPSSGYVQGMNDLVSTLFTVCLEHIMWSRLHLVNGLVDAQSEYHERFQLSRQSPQQQMYQQQIRSQRPSPDQFTLYPSQPPAHRIPQRVLEEIIGGLPPQQHQPSPQSYCIFPNPVLSEDESITPPPTVFTWRHYLSELAKRAIHCPDQDTQVGDDQLSALMSITDSTLTELYDHNAQHTFHHPHTIHQLGLVNTLTMMNHGSTLSPSSSPTAAAAAAAAATSSSVSTPTSSLGAALTQLPAFDPELAWPSPTLTSPLLIGPPPHSAPPEQQHEQEGRDHPSTTHNPCYPLISHEQYDAITKLSILLDPHSIAMLEADTYWLFTLFLDHIQDNYIRQQPGLKRMTIKFTDILQQADPHLHDFMVHEHSIKAIQYCFRWFNCLFLREFMIPHLLRTWDSVLTSAVYSFHQMIPNASLSSSHDLGESTGGGKGIGGGSGGNTSTKIISLEDSFVYFGIALLLFFRKNILALDNFADIITFIQQDIPHLTHTFKQSDLDMLLANLYIYQSTYIVSSSSLYTIASLTDGTGGGTGGGGNNNSTPNASHNPHVNSDSISSPYHSAF